MKNPMKTYLITLSVWIATIAAASAHAFLDHAEPRVGSTVNGMPAEVKIWFTERIVLPFSEVKVTDASGDRVDQQDKRVDPANAQVLIESLKPLKPGKYLVSWRVTAVDTHVTHGTFPFTVAQ
jgi:methionine-rich copper-binding protein CopC